MKRLCFDDDVVPEVPKDEDAECDDKIQDNSDVMCPHKWAEVRVKAPYDFETEIAEIKYYE
jgi:hypothetical protein